MRPWTPAQRLALRVLELALVDAHAGDRAAAHFLASDAPWLRFWCNILGVPPAGICQAAADPNWPARYAKLKVELAGFRLSLRTPNPLARLAARAASTRSLRQSPPQPGRPPTRSLAPARGAGPAPGLR